MARSFYAETKRISNKYIMQDLGWSPAFPNYQRGLISVYKSEMDTAHAVILAGHVDVPAARRRIIKEALPRHVRLSRAEPGCLRFSITEDNAVKNRYNLVEIFENKAAFAAHQKRSAASDWAVAAQGLEQNFHIVVDTD